MPLHGNEVFGLVHEGAVHVQDLMRPVSMKLPGNGEGNPVEEAMALFGKTLDGWLPCFGIESESQSGALLEEL